MSPARLYDTQASMLLRAHDNCGATSMGQDVSADRAQEHSGEPAVTSITHNQKLSTVRSIDESLSGVSLHRSFSHRLGEGRQLRWHFAGSPWRWLKKSTPIMDPTTRNLRDLPRIDRLNGRTR